MITSVADATCRVFSWIFSKIVLACYRWFFVDPLRRLYFRGPYLMGYGFWGGKSAREICTRAHDVMSEVWEVRQDLCEATVEAKFEAFLVGCELILYGFVAFAVISFGWNALKNHYSNQSTERMVVKAVETLANALDQRQRRREKRRGRSRSPSPSRSRSRSRSRSLSRCRNKEDQDGSDEEPMRSPVQTRNQKKKTKKS